MLKCFPWLLVFSRITFKFADANPLSPFYYFLFLFQRKSVLNSLTFFAFFTILFLFRLPFINVPHVDSLSYCIQDFVRSSSVIYSICFVFHNFSSRLFPSRFSFALLSVLSLSLLYALFQSQGFYLDLFRTRSDLVRGFSSFFPEPSSYAAFSAVCFVFYCKSLFYLPRRLISLAVIFTGLCFSVAGLFLAKSAFGFIFLLLPPLCSSFSLLINLLFDFFVKLRSHIKQLLILVSFSFLFPLLYVKVPILFSFTRLRNVELNALFLDQSIAHRVSHYLVIFYNSSVLMPHSLAGFSDSVFNYDYPKFLPDLSFLSDTSGDLPMSLLGIVVYIFGLPFCVVIFCLMVRFFLIKDLSDLSSRVLFESFLFLFVLSLLPFSGFDALFPLAAFAFCPIFWPHPRY